MSKPKKSDSNPFIYENLAIKNAKNKLKGTPEISNVDERPRKTGRITKGSLDRNN